jgi:ABC-type transporter MlaC component
LPGHGFTISKEITSIAPDAKIIALEAKPSEFPKAIDRALELMADIIVLRNLGEETESKINLSLQKAHKAGIIVSTPSYCGTEKEVTIFEALTSGVSFGREKLCGQKNALKVSLDTTLLPSFDFRENIPHLTAIYDRDRLSITATMAGVSALLLEKKNDLTPREIKKVFKASRREFGFKNKIIDGKKALEEVDRLAMKKEVEAYSDKMKKHIESLIAAKDKESLRGELSTCFSFPHMSKLALGNHWTLLSVPEKDEFLSLLKENLVKGLIKVILKKEGKPDITVKESKTKGNEATVKAYVKQKEVDIELIFQFVKLEDKWFVYDVIVDSASLLERYKHDFQEYMKKHSFNQLLNKMKKNLID